MIVTIAGNPSGIAATARPTEVMKISTGGIFLNNPIKNIAAQIIKQIKPSVLPT